MLPPTPASLPFDGGADTEQPVYANAVAVHRSPDEIIVDLAFAAPNRASARVRSRVAMSPRLALRLSKLLAKAAEEQ